MRKAYLEAPHLPFIWLFETHDIDLDPIGDFFQTLDFVIGLDIYLPLPLLPWDITTLHMFAGREILCTAASLAALPLPLSLSSLSAADHKQGGGTRDTAHFTALIKDILRQ